MNWVDYTALGVIGLSVVVSLFRGFVNEVLSLVVWFVAFWIAFTFVDEAAVMLESAIAAPSARVAIAFGGLFLAALVIGGMINYLVGRLVKGTGLSGTDRLLGAVFGGVRGLVVVFAVVVFAGLTPLPKESWWQQSILMPYFIRGAGWVVDRLPEPVREYVDYEADSGQPI